MDPAQNVYYIAHIKFTKISRRRTTYKYPINNPTVNGRLDTLLGRTRNGNIVNITNGTITGVNNPRRFRVISLERLPGFRNFSDRQYYSRYRHSIPVVLPCGSLT